MAKPEIMQVSSSEIRIQFQEWLSFQYEAGTRFVVIEGLTSSGKTTLTEQPFIFGMRRSTNIEMDGFLPRDLPGATPYDAAIDRSALKTQIEIALGAAPLVVIQGAIVWPLVQPVASGLGPDRVSVSAY